MNIKTIIMALMTLSSVHGFNSIKPNTNFKYVGDTKPIGYFDPMRITSSSPKELIKYVREGELQHGRAAMIGFISLLTSELLTDDLGVNALSSESLMNQFPFWFSVALFEFARMKAGWKNPFTKNGKAFKLEDDYQPGNVLSLDEDKYSDELLNKELNNGRLAMIGTLGVIAQELVTGQTAF